MQIKKYQNYLQNQNSGTLFKLRVTNINKHKKTNRSLD